MANTYFQFKQFIIHQDKTAMKVTTDACLFGAVCASRVQEKDVKILDIGTGTGLLALMLAQSKKELSIDAVEIDEAAALQAGENTAASPWAGHIRVIHADIKDYKPEDKYDIIVSNPPFYEQDLKGRDAGKNKAHHDEGLLLTELFSIIKNLLAPGGRFYILLPYKRHAEPELLCKQNQLTTSQRILVRQTVNHDYFRVIIEGRHAGNNDTAAIETELAVKDDQGVYSAAFSALLKDYYLYL